MFGSGRAAINEKTIAKETLLFGGNGPVSEGRDIWVDEALFVSAPAGRMVGIRGMVKDGDAEHFIAERTFDVAPGRALLLAGTIA